MRIAALALISVLALAACSKGPAGGQTPNAGTASSGGINVGNGMFPNIMQGSYRLEANMIHRSGETTPIVMIHDGPKMRMEMTSRQGPMTIVMNQQTHDAFTLVTMSGHQVAMHMNTTGMDNPMQEWVNREGLQVTHGGPCAAAGENGSEWTSTRAAGDPTPSTTPAEPHTACVTNDGVILQVKDGDRVVWQTTRVQRGPQDASLFVIPPGVQVMDLGNAGSLLARARSHAGK